MVTAEIHLKGFNVGSGGTTWILALRPVDLETSHYKLTDDITVS